jgi:hypothetical protein
MVEKNPKLADVAGSNVHVERTLSRAVLPEAHAIVEVVAGVSVVVLGGVVVRPSTTREGRHT